MKAILKKWWFWLIVFIAVIILFVCYKEYIEERKIKQSLSNIGQGATDFINGIDNTESHLDEFSYNYETGEVKYTPSKITLEMYDKVKEKMTQGEVISILGKYDNKLDRGNTYILEWGNSYSPTYDGYWIQIVFDKDENVLNKYQVGLK